MSEASSVSKLKVFFAGTPQFAADILSFLLEEDLVDIVAVYSQPDRKAGRGKKIQQSAVKQLAHEHGLPVYQPPNWHSQEDLECLTALSVDLGIVIAYGLLLPIEMLNIPKFGCINVHASTLPRWRGAAPIQRAIEAGDNETGVTIMQMDEGLDTGAILHHEPTTISNLDTADRLQDKLVHCGQKALAEALNQIAQGTATAVAQPTQGITYARKLQKSEGLLDWNLSAEELDFRIRAFTPFPRCYSFIERDSAIEGQRTQFLQAEPSDFVPDESTPAMSPGTIVSVKNNQLSIQCGAGVIVVSTLQFAGKNPMTSKEALRGYPELLKVGARFQAA